MDTKEVVAHILLQTEATYQMVQEHNYEGAIAIYDELLALKNKPGADLVLGTVYTLKFESLWVSGRIKYEYNDEIPYKTGRPSLQAAKPSRWQPKCLPCWL